MKSWSKAIDRRRKATRSPLHQTGVYLDGTWDRCPNCKAALVFKISKLGNLFVGCPGFPTCDFTRDVSAYDRSASGNRVIESDFAPLTSVPAGSAAKDRRLPSDEAPGPKEHKLPNRPGLPSDDPYDAFLDQDIEVHLEKAT